MISTIKRLFLALMPKKKEQLNNTKYLILFSFPSLNGLIYYSLVDSKQNPSPVFWANNKNPKGVGPFCNIHEAATHYKEYLLYVNRPKLSKNLIKIDFTNKRQIK
jgi:hypothetical protein